MKTDYRVSKIIFEGALKKVNAALSSVSRLEDLCPSVELTRKQTERMDKAILHLYKAYNFLSDIHEIEFNDEP